MMIRFKKAVASVQACITRIFPLHSERQHGSQRSCHLPRPSEPVHLQVPSFSHLAPNRGQQPTSVPLHAIRNIPATVTIDTHVAHVCKFSHGSGLIVFVNGALITAARVALKVNIATLELVRRLPLDELSAIGACLAAAFADDGRAVDVAWAEVGTETEREWREAERSWTRFPGGPYETYGEERSDTSLMQRSFRQFEERERSRLEQQRGLTDVAEWVAFQGRWSSGSSREPCSLHSDATTSLLGLHHAHSQSRPVVAASEPNAQPARSFSPSLPTTWTEGTNVKMTANERKAILRNEHPRETLSKDALGKDNFRGSWSPGPGDGPIMSGEDFDALPEWSDIENGAHRKSAGSQILEPSEVVQREEMTRGRIW